VSHTCPILSTAIHTYVSCSCVFPVAVLQQTYADLQKIEALGPTHFLVSILASAKNDAGVGSLAKIQRHKNVVTDFGPPDLKERATHENLPLRIRHLGCSGHKKKAYDD